MTTALHQWLGNYFIFLRGLAKLFASWYQTFNTIVCRSEAVATGNFVPASPVRCEDRVFLDMKPDSLVDKLMRYLLLDINGQPIF
jgi:hypothetical protein